MATYEFDIKRPDDQGPLKISVSGGRSIVILGANGSGKTRLGVQLERDLYGRAVLRLTAQKSLRVSENLTLIPLESARTLHEYGSDGGGPHSKEGNRFGGKPATHPVNDFDALLQRLFADHVRVASAHLELHKADPGAIPPTTNLERVKDLWNGLLPHRILKLTPPTSIEVLPRLAGTGIPYPGSEMSDGERAILYFLAQCLVAPIDAAIIIDEPEGHVNRAILGPLWSAIEASRSDCAFIYITHDVDFANSRAHQATYAVRSYHHHSSSWDIDEVNAQTGIPEHVAAQVVGSRRPILFVEGERGTTDAAIYDGVYSTFTVVPVGSCEVVVHAVASYNNTNGLHRLVARGLVDADDRDATERDYLLQKDVHILPVAEIENVFLLPQVFAALADALMAPSGALESMHNAILSKADHDVEAATVRHTIRQLDRKVKRVVQSLKSVSALKTRFEQEVAALDVEALAVEYRVRLTALIQAGDVEGVLAVYDNKGMLSEAAKILGLAHKKALIEKVVRLLESKDDRGSALRGRLESVLPRISV